MSEVQVITSTKVNTSFDVCITKTECFDKEGYMYLVSQDILLKEELRQLKAYFKRKEGNGYSVQVNYVLGKNIKEEYTGRLYPKGVWSLTRMPKNIRGFLGKKYYWDVDMKNAQPNILLQLAKANGWVCNALELFCNTRDVYLNQLQEEQGLTRGEAKDRLIQLFFGSNYIDGLPAFIKNELYPELQKLKVNISIGNQELYIKFNKKTPKEDITRTVMAHVLQTIEKDILILIDNAMTLNKRSMDVLIFDGGLVRKLPNEEKFPEEILRRCEKYVFEKSGYSITLVAKELETNIVMPEGMNDDVLPASAIVDDSYASKKFIELMGDNIINENNIIYIFDENTGVWSDDENMMDKKIEYFKDELIFKKYNELGKISIINYSGIAKNRANMKTFLLPNLNLKTNFFHEGIERAKFKLLFKDGIYDFKTEEFTKGFDKTLVFNAMINRNFPKDVNQEDYNFVNKTFFVDPFNNTEVPQIFKHYFMRGILGDNEMKKFLLMLGPNDSSKGMFVVFLKYVFKSLIAEFTGNSLLARQSGGEATKELSWIKKICNKRLAIAQEIRCASQSDKIDANLIKTITSGGDGLQIRRNFMDEETIVNYSFLMIFANDMPRFAPIQDVSSRLVPIQYNYSFKPNPTLMTEKQADPKLKQYLQQDKYADALIQIIIDEYNKWRDEGFKQEPTLTENMLSFKEIISPSENIKEILEEEYEITGSENDYVIFNDLKKTLKGNERVFTDVKLALLLDSIGIKSKIKKIDKKLKVCRIGIKLKEE